MGPDVGPGNCLLGPSSGPIGLEPRHGPDGPDGGPEPFLGPDGPDVGPSWARLVLSVVHPFIAAQNQHYSKMEFVSKNAKKNIENHFDNEAKKAAKAGRYKDLSGERQSDAVEFVRGMVKEAGGCKGERRPINQILQAFCQGAVGKSQSRRHRSGRSGHRGLPRRGNF